MKAAYIEQFGGPELIKFGDLPDPVAAAGEIVVEVIAASVNAADWKLRRGHYGSSNFPLIPGRDFSGVVSTVGDGVADFRIGDAVFAVCETGQEGAYAGEDYHQRRHRCREAERIITYRGNRPRAHWTDGTQRD